MSTNAHAAQERTDTDHALAVDERDERAFCEYLTVLENVPRVAGGPGMYVVVRFERR